jgi:hypothetical protein
MIDAWRWGSSCGNHRIKSVLLTDERIMNTAMMLQLRSWCIEVKFMCRCVGTWKILGLRWCTVYLVAKALLFCRVHSPSLLMAAPAVSSYLLPCDPPFTAERAWAYLFGLLLLDHVTMCWASPRQGLGKSS